MRVFRGSVFRVQERLSPCAVHRRSNSGNGHNIIASMLAADGIRFRMRENAFISVSDPSAFQAAADRIDPYHIQESPALPTLSSDFRPPLAEP